MQSRQSSPDVPDRYAVEDNEEFIIESLSKNIRFPARYQFVRPIGGGGGGIVLLAKDLTTDNLVAIKKVTGPFSGREMAKRCLREIFLLRTIQHPNIINLMDSFLEGKNPDLFFVMEFKPMDLRRRLKDQQPLPILETKHFAYQLFSALSYMHQRGVVHRDLKPENLLLDAEGQLMICDLGLARPADLHMTGYVSTRFYRAPEIMLSWKNYGDPVDVWSAGCILSEMLTGHVLFPGVDHVHHMNLILELLGTPSEPVLDKICGEKTKGYLMMLPRMEGLDFRRQVFSSPEIPDEAIDLLRHLLILDPTARLTAKGVLDHPFFDEIRQAYPSCVSSTGSPSTGTKSYDPTGFDQMSLAELQEAVRREVALFTSGQVADGA